LLPAGARAFEIDGEDPSVVRAVYSHVTRIARESEIEVRLYEPARGRPHPRFVVRVDGDVEALLEFAGVADAAGRLLEPPRRIAS
jgi:hypothetical protein